MQYTSRQMQIAIIKGAATTVGKSLHEQELI